MVARGRAAGQQQLGHRSQRRDFDHLRREIRPHLIKSRQPAEQLSVLRGGNRPRQALVHVVMRVDQARYHQMTTHIQHFVGRLRQFRRRSDCDDPVVLDIQAAVAQLAPGAVHRNQHVCVLDQHRFAAFICACVGACLLFHRHSSSPLYCCRYGMPCELAATARLIPAVPVRPTVCKVVRTRCGGHATAPPRPFERRWPGYPACYAVFGVRGIAAAHRRNLRRPK
jgi:hypothetical protein